jgi:hypothetical protein
MIISTAFTLFVVPSIYMLLAGEHKAKPAPADDRPGAHGASQPATA